MKRTPLKRKTPLARGTKGLKRTRLARVSVKKSTWRQLYKLKKDADSLMFRKCALCKVTHHYYYLEPHHPAGQVEARILVYVWICSKCHRWIHDHGKAARAAGMILPEFDGRKSTPETPNYFGVTLP